MAYSINDIVSLDFRFINVLSSFVHTKEVELPLTGDDMIMTVFERDSYNTSVKKYSASAELLKQVRSVIEQYDITGWIGAPSDPPKVIDEERGGTVNMLYIKFANDNEELITFRETPDETGKEAAFALRRIILDSLTEETLISSEEVYPKLSECKKLREEHGPVCKIESRYFSTGMMAFSNLTIVQTIEMEGPKLKVTRKEQRGKEPEKIQSAEIDSDIMDRLQTISDTENLPVWNYAAIDPEKMYRNDGIMDYIPPSCDIDIYYDDTPVTGIPRVKCSIGDAVCKLGGKEIYRSISDLIHEAMEKAGLIPESTPPKLSMPLEMTTSAGWGLFGAMNAAQQAQAAAATGFVSQTSSQVSTGTGASSGTTWTCTCGSVNTTNFCPNCGGARI